MKHTLFLLILIALAQSVFSQDLIVTSEGNSLNCKITKITNKEIYYVFIQDGVVRDSSLSKQSVLEYKFNKFAVNDTLEGRAINHEDYPHYRVALNYGLSKMTNFYPDVRAVVLNNYYNELYSGRKLSVDFSYYFFESFGVGFKSSLFNTANRINSIEVYEEYPDLSRFGTMSDDVTIFFVGPSVSTRFLSILKNDAMLINLSLGYMGYSDDVVLIDPYQLKGSTVGIALDIGYDLSISKHVALGIQFSLNSGLMSEYTKTYNSGTETIELWRNQYVDLGQIDFSVGLRFLK